MSKARTSATRPVRRFRVGFLSVMQIAFVLAIFLAVNFLSSQVHQPLDLSDDLGFTLSPSTTRFLESDTVRDRETPIRMVVAFPASSPYYERIRPIAEEFARISGGKIKLELIDPFRASDRAIAVAAEYNLVYNQEQVVIDARQPGVDEDPTPGQRSPHVHIVLLDHMLIYEQGNTEPLGFLGEDAIRRGLIDAIEGKQRRMWVFADKSDLSNVKHEGVWKTFVTNLGSQNILAEAVNLAETERVPDDVSGVAIIAAKYDFTPEEIAVLEDYWRRPRSAILVTTGTENSPPRLRAFLRAHGITPQPDRVISVTGDAVQTAVTAQFTQMIDFTRDLWGKSTTLEGATRSLEVREGANDLMSQGIHPYGVLKAGPQFWGEREFPSEHPTRDPDAEPLAPIVAASVVRGAANDAKLAGETSRMIVIGNTEFLVPDKAYKENLDFLASGVNWLIGRESLTGEGPANIRVYKLPLLPPQITFINRVNLVLVPAILLALGGLIWSSRRS